MKTHYMDDVIEENVSEEERKKEQEKEEVFREKLHELITLGKRNGGMLSQEKINAELADMHLDDEKMDLVTQFLEGNRIEIYSEEETSGETDEADEEELEEDDASESELHMIEKEEAESEQGYAGVGTFSENVNIEDPVRLYLKDIGKVGLLNADQEIVLAKKIESGKLAEKILAKYYGNGAIDIPVTKQMVDECFKQESYEEVTAEEQASFEEALEEKYEEFIGKGRTDLFYIREDGEDAKKRLSEANLRLVVSVAKKYIGRGMQFLDLIQEGNLGLMKAVDKFEYRKGFKFSTYATWWIRQAITRAIADQARTIRIPVHMVETINKFVRVRRQLTTELGREPTAEEIAKVMELPVERVNEIMKISQEPVSLETPIGEEDDSNLGDFVPDEKTMAPAEAAAYEHMKEQINEVLTTLSSREQKVLRLRFGLDDGRPRTLEEVGLEFGVTRERIRQIEAKALRKLRHPSRGKKLKDYLD